MDKNKEKHKDPKKKLKSLRRRVAELEKLESKHKRMEKEFQRVNRDLSERLKELNCLYGLSKLAAQPDISLEDIFQGTANLIPPAWQYPDVACGKITFENKEFKTNNFKKTRWAQSAKIKVRGKKAGTVEVYYLKKRPEIDEGPFLKEEKDLINALAERLGRIAERKRAEKALHESKERFRSLVETTSDWIWEVDVNGVYTYISPKVKDLLGYEPEELIGKRPFDLMPPDEAERVAGIFRAVMESRESFTILENTNLNKKGQRVVLETSGVPIFDTNGDLLGYRGIDRDITERKKLEHLKDEFVNTVSHELRTPLAIIKNSCHFMEAKRGEKLDDKQKKYLGVVKQNLDRLNRLVGNILDYQKLSAEKMSFEVKKNNINALVKEVTKEMLDLAKDKDISLTTNLAKDLPKIKFDKDRILEVLLNLVNNAVKFTKKGSITIKTARTRDGICVSVKDTGMGIKKKEISNLFQPFTQIATGEKRRPPGTGLGLAISRKIIEQHEGKIWAESEYRKGSTFSFTLSATR